jgi:hypothetical protein
MMYRPTPVAADSHVPALVIGNGNERCLRKLPVDGMEIWQVETSVDRGHGFLSDVTANWKLDQVNMEVDDVKCVRAAADLLNHYQVAREVLAYAREPQTTRNDRL